MQRDIEKIKSGINENVSHLLHTLLTFTINLVIAFNYGWKLALIIIAYLPLVLIITDVIIGNVNKFVAVFNKKKLWNIFVFPFKMQALLSKEELNGYAAAANVAEEVFSGIRTVFAFSGERVELERYKKELSPAKTASRRRGLLSGIGDGILRFSFFGTAALIFWFGVQWVLDDRDKVDKEYTAAVLMIVGQLILLPLFLNIWEHKTKEITKLHLGFLWLDCWN